MENDTDWTQSPWRELAEHNARMAIRVAELLAKDYLTPRKMVDDARREAELWSRRAQGLDR